MHSFCLISGKIVFQDKFCVTWSLLCADMKNVLCSDLISDQFCAQILSALCADRISLMCQQLWICYVTLVVWKWLCCYVWHCGSWAVSSWGIHLHNLHAAIHHAKTCVTQHYCPVIFWIKTVSVSVWYNGTYEYKNKADIITWESFDNVDIVNYQNN